MLIINSEEYEKRRMSGFLKIEPYMEALISHESIHVVIKRLVDEQTSDALDDLEVIVRHGRLGFQVTLNNMAFASDASGIVLPSHWEEPM